MRAHGCGHAAQIAVARREKRVRGGLGVIARGDAGRIPNMQPFAPVGNFLIGAFSGGGQLFDVIAAMAHQFCARLGEFHIPHIQRIRHRGLHRRGAQYFVALLQRAVVALQGVIIGGAQLGERHIDHAAALGGAVLYGAQILRRKQNACDVSHQFAGARCIAPCDFDFALARRGQDHFHIVRAVVSLGVYLYGGEIRVPADQIAILPRAVRSARTAQIQRLQQVRFALSVIAQQHVYARAGRKIARFIIAEMIQLGADDVHDLPPCN